MSYLHCKIQYGVTHVAGVFETVVPAASNISFRTGDIVLPVTLPAKPWVYTGTQSEGSTDGTIEQDFKAPKVGEILRNTEQLLKDGVMHSSYEFAATDEAIEAMSHIDVTVDPFIQSINGNYYEIVDAPDLAVLEASCAARRLSVLDSAAASGGEGDLISDITAAANTQLAMDAINDNRT